MENKNIILIGMPGCGKSTCGVLLSKVTCKSFLDTDLVIQENEGMRLQEIINTRGTDYFADAEERAIVGVKAKNTVIATGGSAVYSEKAMAHLKSDGVVVYIKIGYDEMMKRLVNKNSRGILLREGETLESMYEERTALYEKYADAIVENRGDTVEYTVEKICNALSLQF